MTREITPETIEKVTGHTGLVILGLIVLIYLFTFTLNGKGPEAGFLGLALRGLCMILGLVALGLFAAGHIIGLVAIQ